ncbi:MAG: hypothetical protein KGM92_04285 [Acidobacteriota bacterium]|uniref:Uncharacterized protein n=1 Tax=Candidatus Acidiferrum panamense TaxID=2741543 RepID=A0A7V8SZX4_9BACT|nr:hypothetical protein [Candidatus Acidoferrum panamensis]MDE3157968.1 hypothetical protein [Acidobacteriota bacterium]
MNKAILAFALAAGLSTSAMAAAFKGYIIDEKCSKVASMKGDVDCANKCIKGGSPAVLLTDDGKVYKIADQAKVTPMAGKEVTINGKLSGDTITVDSVK